MRRFRNKRNQNRSGAVTVEVAFVLPVFFMCLFGFMEITRGFMIRNSLKIAAYRATRTVIVPGATSQEAIDVAETVLSTVGVNVSSVEISPAIIDADTKQVTVTITVPLADNSWVVPKYLSNIELEESCTMTREPNLNGMN
ncbi:MAG: pilus assembly protein [Pirellulaceae bacterium]